jgi:predicted Zn-dependent peptidase
MLLSTLLGGGMSSRLFQEVREKRGLVYSVYSFTAPCMDGGLFGIYAGTGESEAAELIPVTLDELQKVQCEVTLAELARAVSITDRLNGFTRGVIAARDFVFFASFMAFFLFANTIAIDQRKAD